MNELLSYLIGLPIPRDALETWRGCSRIKDLEVVAAEDSRDSSDQLIMLVVDTAKLLSQDECDLDSLIEASAFCWRQYTLLDAVGEDAHPDTTVMGLIAVTFQAISNLFYAADNRFRPTDTLSQVGPDLIVKLQVFSFPFNNN